MIVSNSRNVATAAMSADMLSTALHGANNSITGSQQQQGCQQQRRQTLETPVAEETSAAVGTETEKIIFEFRKRKCKSFYLGKLLKD